MWQKLTRTSKKYDLQSEITSFVSVDGTTEIHLIKITNLSEEEQEVTPIAAIPVYGRSADNIRDHRHVTSLLHRVYLNKKLLHDIVKYTRYSVLFKYTTTTYSPVFNIVSYFQATSSRFKRQISDKF